MKLFGKDVDPKELLGMDPEDLKKKLDAAVTKDDLKTVTDQIAGFTSGLTELKKTLEGLKPAAADENLGDPDPLAGENSTTRLLADPDKFIDGKTKPITDATLVSMATLEEIRARQDPRFRAIFEKYGDDLTKIAGEKFPVNTRASKDFWAFHIRAYLGDKLVKGELQSESFPSLMGTSTTGLNADGTTDDPNHGFKPEQADWLKKRGVPLDKAQRISELMHRDGEPINLENYKAQAHA